MQHTIGLPAAISGTVAMFLILTQLACFRSVVIGELIRLYAVQSFLVAGIAAVVAVTTHAWDLGVLAGVTFLLKVVFLPGYMSSLVRGVSKRVEIPVRINVTLSLMLAAGVTGLAILVAARLTETAGVFLPRADLATALAIIFIGFLLAILRPNALAQVVAFLTIENGLFFGTVTLAPGLPFVIDMLLLVDVLVAVVVFGVLVRVLVDGQNSAAIHPFERLIG
ncbi:MAG: hypothetical protein ACYDHD_07880 [Vulcanimicrobiaceae bacterium]